MRNAGQVWILASLFSVVSHVTGAVIASSMLERGTPVQPVMIELSNSDVGFDTDEAQAVSDAEAVSTSPITEKAIEAPIDAEIATAKPVEESTAEASPVDNMVASSQSDSVAAIEDSAGAAAVDNPVSQEVSSAELAQQAASLSAHVENKSENASTVPEPGSADVVVNDGAATVAASDAAVPNVSSPVQADQAESSATVAPSEQSAGAAPAASSDVAVPDVSRPVEEDQTESSAAVVPAEQIADATSSAPVSEAAPVVAGVAESAAASEASSVQSETVVAALEETSPSPVVDKVNASQAAEHLTSKQQDGVKTALVLPKLQKPVERKDSRSAIADFLRSEGSGRCFLAVPIEIRQDGARVDGYAEADSAMSSFAARFEQHVDANLTFSRIVISSEQCAALEMVQALGGGAGHQLALQIEATEIAEGQELAVNIHNLTMPWFALLLVDNDGMAMNLSQYVTKDGNAATFRKPMHLLGNGLSQPQLLIALSASERLDLAEFKDKRPAADVIPLIMGEGRRKKLKTDIAIASFRVH